MRKLLWFFILTLSIPSICLAQEYTANTWASFASVVNTTQTKWPFPSKSRTVTVMNGGATPVCIAFNGIDINQDCTSNVTNQVSTGDNRVFRLPGAQWITLNNMVTSGITLRSSAGAASPISVLVNY